MAKVILDASALLALFNNEKGAENVRPHLPISMMSVVNLYEVITVLLRYEYTADEAYSEATSLIGEVIPFSEKYVCAAADIHARTRSLGLSLGDCVCLAVGQVEQAIILTADTIWRDTALDIEIEVIR